MTVEHEFTFPPAPRGVVRRNVRIDYRPKGSNPQILAHTLEGGDRSFRQGFDQGGFMLLQVKATGPQGRVGRWSTPAYIEVGKDFSPLVQGHPSSRVVSTGPSPSPSPPPPAPEPVPEPEPLPEPEPEPILEPGTVPYPELEPEPFDFDDDDQDDVDES